MRKVRRFLAVLLAVVSDALQILSAETVGVGTIIELIFFPVIVWLLETNEVDWTFLPELVPYLQLIPLTTIAVIDVIYAKSKFRKTFSVLTKETEKFAGWFMR